jgi:hypothetical protein
MPIDIDLLCWKCANTALPFTANLDAFTNSARADKTIRDSHVDRYPLELLQNARDAMERGRLAGQPLEGHALFVITHDALIVANDGEDFRLEDKAVFNAIVLLGKSNKVAGGRGELVGHKGIGLRSVLQVTDAFQLGWRDSSGQRQYLAFGSELTKRYLLDLPNNERLVQDLDADWLDAVRRYAGNDEIPVFALPHPCETSALGADAELMWALGQPGIQAEEQALIDQLQNADLAREMARVIGTAFSTVIRLPFKTPAHREGAIDLLMDGLDPTSVLLLGHLARVGVVAMGPQPRARCITLSSPIVGEETIPTEVRIEVRGERPSRQDYLVFQEHDPKASTLAERDSDEARLRARLAERPCRLAIPLGEDKGDHPLYMYYPIRPPGRGGEGLRCVLHLPVFVTPNRQDLLASELAHNRAMAHRAVSWIREEVLDTLAERGPDLPLRLLPGPCMSPESDRELEPAGNIPALIRLELLKTLQRYGWVSCMDGQKRPPVADERAPEIGVVAIDAGDIAGTRALVTLLAPTSAARFPDAATLDALTDRTGTYLEALFDSSSKTIGSTKLTFVAPEILATGTYGQAYEVLSRAISPEAWSDIEGPLWCCRGKDGGLRAVAQPRTEDHVVFWRPSREGAQQSRRKVRIPDVPDQLQVEWLHPDCILPGGGFQALLDDPERRIGPTAFTAPIDALRRIAASMAVRFEHQPTSYLSDQGPTHLYLEHLGFLVELHRRISEHQTSSPARRTWIERVLGRAGDKRHTKDPPSDWKREVAMLATLARVPVPVHTSHGITLVPAHRSFVPVHLAPEHEEEGTDRAAGVQLERLGELLAHDPRFSPLDLARIEASHRPDAQAFVALARFLGSWTSPPVSGWLHCRVDNGVHGPRLPSASEISLDPGDPAWAAHVERWAGHAWPEASVVGADRLLRFDFDIAAVGLEQTLDVLRRCPEIDYGRALRARQATRSGGSYTWFKPPKISLPLLFQSLNGRLRVCGGGSSPPKRVFHDRRPPGGDPSRTWARFVPVLPQGSPADEFALDLDLVTPDHPDRGHRAATALNALLGGEREAATDVLASVDRLPQIGPGGVVRCEDELIEQALMSAVRELVARLDPESAATVRWVLARIGHHLVRVRGPATEGGPDETINGGVDLSPLERRLLATQRQAVLPSWVDADVLRVLGIQRPSGGLQKILSGLEPTPVDAAEIRSQVRAKLDLLLALAEHKATRYNRADARDRLERHLQRVVVADDVPLELRGLRSFRVDRPEPAICVWHEHWKQQRGAHCLAEAIVDLLGVSGVSRLDVEHLLCQDLEGARAHLASEGIDQGLLVDMVRSEAQRFVMGVRTWMALEGRPLPPLTVPRPDLEQTDAWRLACEVLCAAGMEQAQFSGLRMLGDDVSAAMTWLERNTEQAHHCAPRLAEHPGLLNRLSAVLLQRLRSHADSVVATWWACGQEREAEDAWTLAKAAFGHEPPQSDIDPSSPAEHWIGSGADASQVPSLAWLALRLPRLRPPEGPVPDLARSLLGAAGYADARQLWESWLRAHEEKRESDQATFLERLGHHMELPEPREDGGGAADVKGAARRRGGHAGGGATADADTGDLGETYAFSLIWRDFRNLGSQAAKDHAISLLVRARHHKDYAVQKRTKRLLEDPEATLNRADLASDEPRPDSIWAFYRWCCAAEDRGKGYDLIDPTRWFDPSAAPVPSHHATPVGLSAPPEGALPIQVEVKSTKQKDGSFVFHLGTTQFRRAERAGIGYEITSEPGAGYSVL